MTLEYSESQKSENKQRGSESALKSLVMFLWRGLGMPVAWALAMWVLLIYEQINGMTIGGMFWITVCLFAYFLSRIANAAEELVSRSET